MSQQSKFIDFTKRNKGDLSNLLGTPLLSSRLEYGKQISAEQSKLFGCQSFALPLSIANGHLVSVDMLASLVKSGN